MRAPPHKEGGAWLLSRGLRARLEGLWEHRDAVSFRTTAPRRPTVMWWTPCRRLRRRCRSFRAASYSGGSTPGPPTLPRSAPPAPARPPSRPPSPEGLPALQALTPTHQHSVHTSQYPGYTASPQSLYRLRLTKRVSKPVSRDYFSDSSV